MTPEPADDTASLADQLRGEIILQKLDVVEALLRAAESRVAPRTEWPEHLKRFPFSLSTRLQHVLLRILELVFRDQREYDAKLAHALRESLVLHRALRQQGERQEERLRALEARQSRMIERIIALSTEPAGDATAGSAPAKDPAFDAFYAAFENRFRGSEAEISERLQVYVDIVAATAAVNERAPLVDLGCGRGEWLQLLRDAGIAARGVDINQVTIRSCRERGLDVVEASVIDYLRTMPDQAAGAITGFHIIEHLPFNVLLELFRESARVLRPGGVFIVETPNPENVIVGSHKFYLDPTHMRPLPPDLVHFAAEFHGLVRVSTLGLHPWPKDSLLSGSPVSDEFNLLFRGPQDYAVLGYKA